MSTEHHDEHSHGCGRGHKHGHEGDHTCGHSHSHAHHGTGDDHSLPLSHADEDRSYRVVGVSGGHEVQMRLASLGLLPGKRIHVVQRRGHGPVMILVHAGKLALGRGISHHLHITPIAEAS